MPAPEQPDATGRGQSVGTVLVIGTGLIGTSIALAARRAGIDVLLSDRDERHARTALHLGAGRLLEADDTPDLVVVAVPPDHLGAAVTDALARYPEAVVTDIGSIKQAPLLDVAAQAPDSVRRYVGSHPMAGSERSGPLAASPALFDGRPWAVTAHAAADAAAVAAVEALAVACGAGVVRMSPAEHDAAVARMSHLPHLMSALVAGRLAGAPDSHLALAGQGVRDVTRVAGSDPALWGQIVAGNAAGLTPLLRELRADLDDLLAAVEGASRDQVAGLLARGVAGTRSIPGKHGGPARASEPVFVSIPDQPGSLARLFADAGESGVNIEDVRIDHDPGRDTGLLEMTVQAGGAEILLAALESKGWVTHR